MGIIRSRTTFPNHAPSLEQICDKIQSVSGLPVTVLEIDVEIPNRFMARIAFACAPDERLKICASREYLRRHKMANSELVDPNQEATSERVTRETPRPNARELIELIGYVGQEMTLFFVAEHALEALGGTRNEPIDDPEMSVFLSEFKRPIDEEALKKRHKENRRNNRMMKALMMISLPVIIPLYFVFGIISCVIGVPFALAKLRQRKSRTSRA